MSDYGRLPLSFEANQGQTDPHVTFTTRGRGARVFLTQDGATFLLRSDDCGPKRQRGPKLQLRCDSKSAATKMTLVGARTDAQVTGEDELPGRTNYFIGNDPAKWRTDVPTYGKVRDHDLYQGVDLVYYGNQQQLEYDFIVAPGADPHDIRLAFEGVDDLRVDDRGDLVLTTAVGEIRQHKPVVYQEVDGKRVDIAGGYELFNRQIAPSPDRHIVAFSVADYDESLPLVIDPTLGPMAATEPWGDGHPGRVLEMTISSNVSGSRVRRFALALTLLTLGPMALPGGPLNGDRLLALSQDLRYRVATASHREPPPQSISIAKSPTAFAEATAVKDRQIAKLTGGDAGESGDWAILDLVPLEWSDGDDSIS